MAPQSRELHDILLPFRFLALLGHVLVTLLCLHAVHDNVLVALPFQYDNVSMENGAWSARSATYVTFACLLVNAISFFGGFTTFDTTLSLFHLTFHSVAGLLLALTIINKGHFYFLWYITLIFSGPQLLADAWAFLSLNIIGRKRVW